MNRRRNIQVSALMVFMLAASTGVWAQGGGLRGKVVGVTDGDTMILLDMLNRQHTIRLSGIDAPETACHAKVPSEADDACHEGRQPFGKSAKRSLSEMTFGKLVVVTVLPGATYGREIGTVYLKTEDGGWFDVNLEQVRRGYAWHYTRYAKEYQDDATYMSYEAAQREAQDARRGLWGGNLPEAPWDYRAAQREMKSGERAPGFK